MCMQTLFLVLTCNCPFMKLFSLCACRRPLHMGRLQDVPVPRSRLRPSRACRAPLRPSPPRTCPRTLAGIHPPALAPRRASDPGPPTSTAPSSHPPCPLAVPGIPPRAACLAQPLREILLGGRVPMVAGKVPRVRVRPGTRMQTGVMMWRWK